MLSANRRFDLAICDIDGCLSPEGPQSFDAEALLQVAHYNQRAEQERDRPQLTLCTGRPVPFAEAMCRLLQNRSVPCVAEGGVWLFHPARNEFWMDPAITETDLEVVRDAERFFRRAYAHRGFSVQPGKTASLSLYHRDRPALLALIPEIEQEAAQRGWPLRISSTWCYLNCDLKHVSKGTGIRRLLEEVPLPRERLAGIGDTLGDRTIADAVGWFACPANADAPIRARAHFVSAQREVHGVLEILDRIRG
jgi:hydroxymethylpyrimidine pyrophosphatase-like HAD family hydrolase